MGIFGKKRERRSRRSDTTPESLLAKIAVIFLLLNIFIVTGLRNVDMLVVTLLVVLTSGSGFVFAIYAKRQLRRRSGRLQGEGLATLGYWGNLIVMLMFLLAFSWFFAMGILRGDLL